MHQRHAAKLKAQDKKMRKKAMKRMAAIAKEQDNSGDELEKDDVKDSAPKEAEAESPLAVIPDEMKGSEFVNESMQQSASIEETLQQQEEEATRALEQAQQVEADQKENNDK